MEKSLKYCLSFLGVLIYSVSLSQVNCNIYSDENCKKSCEISNFAEKIQGNKYADELFDEAIKLCQQNDFAYRERAVPYLKSGDFVAWKKLIDRAVEINPNQNLDYRAWCKFQFLRDYNGAFADLQLLKKYRSSDLGFSQNGDYQLEVVEALCLSGLNQKEKAAELLERIFNKEKYSPGFYDYYQLGVTYFQLGKYDEALKNFEKQSKILDFAENIYYKAKISKIRNKDYLNLKQAALQNYDVGKIMKDAYTHHFNKIYKQQIEQL